MSIPKLALACTLALGLWTRRPSAQEAGRDSASREPRPAVIIAGIPSVVEFSPKLMALEAGQPPVCVRFFVYASQARIQAVRITTTGLGDARLVPPELVSVPDCRRALASGRPLIILPELTATGRELQLVLPHQTFPLSRRPQQGKVIVVAGSGPAVEAPLQIQREAPGQFGTAALWFAGILVPAVVTAAFAYVGHVLLEAYRTGKNEVGDFAKFKEDRRGDLDTFFREFYPRMLEERPSNADFASRIESELGEALSKLPRKERDAIRGELRRKDRDAIVSHLVSVFPEWKAQIMDESGAGNGRRTRDNDDA